MLQNNKMVLSVFCKKQIKETLPGEWFMFWLLCVFLYSSPFLKLSVHSIAVRASSVYLKDIRNLSSLLHVSFSRPKLGDMQE